MISYLQALAGRPECMNWSVVGWVCAHLKQHPSHTHLPVTVGWFELISWQVAVSSQPFLLWQYFSATTVTRLYQRSPWRSSSFSNLLLSQSPSSHPHDLKSLMPFSLLWMSVVLLSSPPLATRPHLLRAVWSLQLLTSLVLSKTGTWCNFLLILSSFLLQKRDWLPSDGREGTGSWPMTAPNQASLLTPVFICLFSELRKLYPICDCKVRRNLNGDRNKKQKMKTRKTCEKHLTGGLGKS